jgi:hypothetical protein
MGKNNAIPAGYDKEIGVLEVLLKVDFNTRR